MSRTLLNLLALALALPIAAHAAPPGKGWRPLRVKVGVLPAPRRAEDAYQGFCTGFERRIEGGSFTAYGRQVAIGGEGPRVEVTVEGETRRMTLPARVELGDKAVLVQRQGAGLVWSSHWGAQWRQGRERFTLIDANADGALWQRADDEQLEATCDAVVGPLSSTAAPWAGVVWSAEAGWEVATDGDEVYTRPAPWPREERDRLKTNEAWALLNGWRLAAGLQPLTWDEAVFEGCQAHATYCHKTGQRAHRQDESNPHYSEKGDDAASSAVLSFAYKTAREGVLEQLGTSYHLSSILAPPSRRAAMAVVGSVFVCNVAGDRSGEGHDHAIGYVWPPHGARGVARSFNFTGEVPMPLPGREMQYKARIGQVILAKVDGEGPYALEVKSDKGQLVKGTLTSPDAPAPGHPATRRRNAGLVILAPDRDLPGNTWFTATLSYKSDDGERALTRTWRFRTGGSAHLVVCHGGHRR